MDQFSLFELKNSNPALSKWVDALQEISSSSDAPDGAAPREELSVVLSVERHVQEKLQIKTYVRRRLKNGGFSKPAMFRFGSESDRKRVIGPDLELLILLESLSESNGWRDATFTLASNDCQALLTRLVETVDCYWQSFENPPLRLDGPRSALLEWKSMPSGDQYLEVTAHNATTLPTTPVWYIDLTDHQIGPVVSEIPGAVLGHLRRMPKQVSPTTAGTINEVLESLPSAAAIPRPKVAKKMETTVVAPRPCLHFYSEVAPKRRWETGQKNRAYLGKLSFLYQDVNVDWGDDSNPSIQIFMDDTLTIVPRDKRAEHKYHYFLVTLGLTEAMLVIPSYAYNGRFRNRFFLGGPESRELLTHVRGELAPQLRAEGWEVTFSDDYPIPEIILVDEWYSDLTESSGTDWFDVDLGILIDGKPVSLLPILLKMIRGAKGKNRPTLGLSPDTPTVVLEVDDHLVSVAQDRLQHAFQTILELFSKSKVDKDKLQISQLQAALLVETKKAQDASQLRWVGPSQLISLAQRLRDFSAIQPVGIPDEFTATLRHYQSDGVAWLQFLREYGLGGILADDMGLGKTVQTLAHLVIEKSENRLGEPCLIVAPTSVISNWKSEAARFAPGLSVLLLHGLDRKKDFKLIKKHDIVLTTYPLVVRDKDVLLAHRFSFIILDEAHTIKNSAAKVTQVAIQLAATHRLCLTGTPMENHLGELWSLFHFLMPGLLGDKDSFRRDYRFPIERGQNSEIQARLAGLTRPFMMRRTKAEVVLDLPEKTEILQKIPLESAQRDLYETIRLTMHQKVRDAIDKKGIERSHIIILDALLKLRQVCCDPRLLKKVTGKSSVHSAKLDHLMEMIPQLIEEGRRILLFSQFTSMLALIEEEIVKQKVPYLKLTGQSTNRPELIAQFQEGDIPVFLISLKAGGTGLNLTAADTVIHYDPWWNPAVEMQATDRAHRIGQTKAVFVYKLITEGTIEEKIVALQEKKQGLADSILGDKKLEKLITKEDLDQLFL